VYGPDGSKLALMNAQTLSKGFVPLSGGATAVYNSNGLAYYRHADWLGSSRFASLPSGTSRLYYDGAYAPYGENYAETGNVDRNFTGQNQDTVNSGAYPLYDFLYREHHPVWGRWLSPDPAGLGAVDPTNPQSLNRYAYVLNNPMTLIDPLGLEGKSNIKLQAAPQSSGCTLNGIYTACSVVYSLLGAGGALPVGVPSNAELVAQWGNTFVYGWQENPPSGYVPCSNRDPNCYRERGTDNTWWAQDHYSSATFSLPISAWSPTTPSSPGGSGTRSADPTLDNRANALAQALNRTGVQTLNSPCTVPRFYLGSAAIGAAGAAVANAPEIVSAASESYPTLLNRFFSWLAGKAANPGRIGATGAAVAVAYGAAKQFCSSY
jgi:RHS repeat-associated protein